MLGVVLGITYGFLIGLVSDLILYISYMKAKMLGKEPLAQMSGAFFGRYMVALACLGLPAFFLRRWTDFPAFLISAALSLTTLGNLLLFVTYYKKGGRFE